MTGLTRRGDRGRWSDSADRLAGDESSACAAAAGLTVPLDRPSIGPGVTPHMATFFAWGVCCERAFCRLRRGGTDAMAQLGYFPCVRAFTMVREHFAPVVRAASDIASFNPHLMLVRRFFRR